MRLLRKATGLRTRPDKAGDRYVAAGAEEARRRGHGYVGTEHVLLALTRDPHGGATKVLSELGVTEREIRASSVLAQLWAPRIDPDALASIGIDLDAVRDRLDATFGYGALEQTEAGMLEPPSGRIQCIMPRLKESLANAVDRAGDRALRDEDVLLGMLSVRDSLAARVLAELGVSLKTAEAAVDAADR